MKKIYLQPETTVSFVMTQNVIAGSETMGGKTDGDGYGDGTGGSDDDDWGARPQWWVDPGL